MDLFEKVKEKGVLIAAHRGVAGGNIACNTIEAFEAALIQGADILEMDVFKTTDSQLYIFHTTAPLLERMLIILQNVNGFKLHPIKPINNLMKKHLY